MAQCNCKIKLNKPRPLAYFLPFHYHLIPGKIRAFFATNIIKPARIWTPKNLCVCQENLSQKNTWPNGHEVAFVLTYDIDTYSGLQKILELKKDPFFSKIKSTVNLVSHGYKFTEKELNALKSNGWEVAIHGDNHDTRLVFNDEVKINSRIERSKEKFKTMNCEVAGIRSPSLLYTEKYFKIIGRHFNYDSSVYFDDGPFSVFKIFPFKIENILEIPISMPMDVHLNFLKLSEEEKFSIWIERFKFVKKYRGMAVLVVHPDSHFFTKDNEGTLRKFLMEVQNHNPWQATCNEIYENFICELKQS